MESMACLTLLILPPNICAELSSTNTILFFIFWTRGASIWTNELGSKKSFNLPCQYQWLQLFSDNLPAHFKQVAIFLVFNLIFNEYSPFDTRWWYANLLTSRWLVGKRCFVAKSKQIINSVCKVVQIGQCLLH